MGDSGCDVERIQPSGVFKDLHLDLLDGSLDGQSFSRLKVEDIGGHQFGTTSDIMIYQTAEFTMPSPGHVWAQPTESRASLKGFINSDLEDKPFGIDALTEQLSHRRFSPLVTLGISMANLKGTALMIRLYTPEPHWGQGSPE